MQTVQSPRDAPDKEGPLIKRGHVVKNWKKRVFRLIGLKLYYYKNLGQQKATGCINLEGASVRKIDKLKEYCFELTAPRDKKKVFYLAAVSDDECEKWMRAITINVAAAECSTLVEDIHARLQKIPEMSPEEAKQALRIARQDSKPLSAPKYEQLSFVRGLLTELAALESAHGMSGSTDSSKGSSGAASAVAASYDPMQLSSTDTVPLSSAAPASLANSMDASHSSSQPMLSQPVPNPPHVPHPMHDSALQTAASQHVPSTVQPVVESSEQQQKSTSWVVAPVSPRRDPQSAIQPPVHPLPTPQEVPSQQVPQTIPPQQPSASEAALLAEEPKQSPVLTRRPVVEKIEVVHEPKQSLAPKESAASLVVTTAGQFSVGTMILILCFALCVIRMIVNFFI